MPRLRIAQITFHRALNCGAVLQAWALQTVLERMGHEVFQPDCNSVGCYQGHFPRTMLHDRSIPGLVRHFTWWIGAGLLSFGFDELKVCRFEQFSRKWLHRLKCDKDEVGAKSDLAVFGSDQIWNERLTLDESDYFFGRPFPANLPRLAYGVSLGDGEVDVGRIKERAKGFFAVSARERSEISEAQVLDPTLLLEPGDYGRIAYPKRLERSPYCLLFNLSGDDMIRRKSHALASSLGLKCVEVNMSQRGLWRYARGMRHAVSPDRFLAYVRDAECVVTNSFHGTTFSLIYNKPFLSFVPARTTGRIVALLGMVGLKNRVVSGAEDIEVLADAMKRALPKEFLSCLAKKRAFSLKWLKDALEEGVNCA